MHPTKISDALQVLNEIRAIIVSTEQDETWTSYDSIEQLLVDLDRHRAQLAAGDLSGMKELRLLFAPTGDLQELSISSGWGERFVALAGGLR